VHTGTTIAIAMGSVSTNIEYFNGRVHFAAHAGGSRGRSRGQRWNTQQPHQPHQLVFGFRSRVPRGALVGRVACIVACLHHWHPGAFVFPSDKRIKATPVRRPQQRRCT
jgi:hypothetical protein